MSPKERALTPARARQLLDYNPQTGALSWKVQHRHASSDGKAGCPERKGCAHRVIRIDGELYQAHRVIWLWMMGHWPANEIDHIDGDGLNNRWSNLREATSSQNKQNTRLRIDNSTGYRGVTFDKNRMRYIARVYIGGTARHLGRFDTAKEAADAAQMARLKYFGPFASSRQTTASTVTED